MDGLAITASYNPKAAGAESSSAFGLTFSGVEGLTVNYGVGSDDGAAGTANNADVTTMKASYAVGPVTLAYSDHSYDSATATRDQDTKSMSVAYTISDAISVSYGTEEISTGEASTVDAEYSKISASYTSGGMTITASQQEAENISYGTGSTEDQDYWGLTLAFAF
jgi:outer membrane protein OmpU